MSKGITIDGTVLPYLPAVCHLYMPSTYTQVIGNSHQMKYTATLKSHKHAIVCAQ